MGTQSYQPLRSEILSPEQTRLLHQHRPLIPIIDTAIDWIFIIMAWCIVALWPSVWTVLLAVPIVGSRFYGLHIIAHDGVHKRLFKNQIVNDLFCDLFVHAPILCITRLSRNNHLDHHSDICSETDPDRHKYVHARKDTPMGFVAFMSGLGNLVPTLRNLTTSKKQDGKIALAYRPVEIVLIVAWQLALFVGLTWGIGWWAYPVLWLLPIYVFTMLGGLLRVFCEHSMLVDDGTADATMRLISFTSNPLERAVFAPHNMHLHAAHHLWPSIPYYNLPDADRVLRASTYADRCVWRGSYIAYLWRYARLWAFSREKAIRHG
jgi:fatty acid desaturase